MDIPLAGPFDTTAAFHDFICSRPPERMNDILVNPPDLRQTLREAFDDSDPIVFSHADLRLDHIYVDPMSGKVTNGESSRSPPFYRCL